MTVDHLPTIIAHVHDRMAAIKDLKVELESDRAGLHELRLVLNLCEALQQQNEFMAGSLAKVGL